MVDPGSIDPNTAIGAGLAILGSKDLLNRFLGPTADYVGGEIKGLIEKCNINLSRVFGHAVKKLGPKINEPGAVNPRVLRQVWKEGAFIEDELAAEYFGGLLASARSPDGRDDRVLSLLSTVRDLSVYDLRLHHLVYVAVRSAGIGQGVRPEQAVWPTDVDVDAHISAKDCIRNMGLRGPDSTCWDIACDSLFTLDKYDLVGSHNGGVEALRPESRIDASPSHFGTKLFLWVHGHAEKRIDYVFDPNTDLPNSPDIPGVSDARRGS